MPGGAIIRCDPLDGAWETLGAGRYRGVVPESIVASSNAWGPDQLSFEVKSVEPGALRPDLLPFTPVELEVDGQLVWAGRVRQRPSDERAHSVTCEGWQYHLDDDAYQRSYVTTRLADSVDIRTVLTAPLGEAVWCAAGSVSNDNGITLMIPKGTVTGVGTRCGVYIDLGVDSTVKRVVLTWTGWAAGTTNRLFFVRGCDSADDTSWGTAEDIYSSGTLVGPTTTTGTFTTARRFLQLFLWEATGATYGNDVWVRISDIKLFRATAYESGNVSVLKADTVIKDALAFAPLLNQSTGLIQAGTFSIPEYRTSGYQTAREIIESVNAYENYDHRIGGADLKTLVYAPKASSPEVVAGEWSGAQFADASVAGDDIFSRVVVTGQGPDGSPLVRSRTQTGTLFDRALPAGTDANRTKVLPIRSAGTASVYDRFGDLWLVDHKLAPFAGKLSATNGLRRWLGGASVRPHSVLLLAGSLAHLAHRVDPDTGAWGREGTIAAATYSHDTRSVEVDVDDRRDHFESILERYGILVDQFNP